MKRTVLILLCCICATNLFAQQPILTKYETGAFPITADRKAAPIYIDAADHWLVQKTASHLQTDLGKGNR